MSNESNGTVLIVDDDPQVVDLYEEFLSDTYAVRTATTREGALAELNEAVDVVILDRRMPELSGDDILELIRDEGYPCRVAMVTAIQPDFDILSLGFDDYFVKPITSAELRDVVEGLLERTAYEADIQNWLSLLSKKAALEREKTRSELEESDEYATLVSELQADSDQAHQTVTEPSSNRLRALFREYDRDESVDG